MSSACKFRNLPLHTGKAADMSELQTHHCATLGQWTCFFVHCECHTGK